MQPTTLTIDNINPIWPVSQDKQQKQWLLYMVRCADDSLYTGITNDLQRRIEEHNSNRKSAKYTRSRQPVTLVYQEECSSRSAALKREIAVKKMDKQQKERLIS